VEELFPVMGVFRLRGSKNHSALELHAVGVEPQCWRYVSSNQIMADLNCKAEPKEISRQRVVLGGYPMAAFKKGGGTVPRGYAELKGEHQGDLAEITSSDTVVCTGCLAC
jgi:hypothetical protein